MSTTMGQAGNQLNLICFWWRRPPPRPVMKLIATSLKCAKWVSTGVGEGHAIGGVGER